MDREAMQMALEALVEINKLSIGENAICLPAEIDGAMDALRQALETEQEPVAWIHNFIEGNVITHIPADIGRHPERWTALYKDPTPCKTCESLAMAVMNDQTYHEKVIPKREWVGLTADEIWKCNKASGSAVEFHICYAHQNVLDFAEAIEAKLKEKNT